MLWVGRQHLLGQWVEEEIHNPQGGEGVLLRIFGGPGGGVLPGIPNSYPIS